MIFYIHQNTSTNPARNMAFALIHWGLAQMTFVEFVDFETLPPPGLMPSTCHDAPPPKNVLPRHDPLHKIEP